MELLEDRFLLAGNLLFQATGPGTVMLRLSGGDVQIVDTATAATVLASKPLGEITEGVRIEGNTFDVYLTIDASTPPIPGGIEFAGGAGTNTLTGPDVPTDWSIDAPDSGSFSGVNTFSGVERLIGGTSDDNFQFKPGGSISGGIDGGGGMDTLNYSAATADLVFTFHADGTVSATDFTNTLGPTAGSDKVVGGTGDNRFVFENGASFPGTIDGGSGGSNTIDFSSYETPVLVDLADGTATVGGLVNGSSMVGLTTDMPVRYLNDGAGVQQATISPETALATLNGGSGVQKASDSFSLTAATPLANLNNGQGVGSRGFLSAATPVSSNWPTMGLQPGYDLIITLTNQDIVYVDLGTPATLGNLLDAIHQADPRLTAAINAAGTGIDIRDSAGGSKNIAVADLGASTAAKTLGIPGAGAGNVLHGKSITGDMRIILTDWSAVAVEIGSATTVQDVLDAIHNADHRLTAVINDAGDGIKIIDAAGGEESLAVENLNGSTTATDLGLTVRSEGNVLNGRPLVSDLRITASDGTVVNVNLREAGNLGKVIDAINAADSRMVAALNEASDGIDIQDSTAGSGSLTIANPSGSTAATDLGLAKTGTGNLLQGNSLFDDLEITLSNGASVQVNLGNPATVADVLAAIQAADSRLTAVISLITRGIRITDSAGGPGNITVANLNGCTAATDLGILGTGTGRTLRGTPVVSPVVSTTLSHVQHAVGGSGDDLLIGSTGNNRLTGGEGSDTYKFSAGWAADTIEDYGILGTDTLDFSAVMSQLTVTIQADGKVSIVDDAGNPNTLEDAEIIENIILGSGNDTFVFESGSTFLGTLNGGGGTNKLDYSAYETAVTVDLATGTAKASEVITSITNIRVIAGGSGDDILTGDSGVNRFEGGPGSDVLKGGAAIDTLVGGEGDDVYVMDGGNDTIREAADGGFDTLDYSRSTGAISVNLAGFI
ncbi:MAG: hypothetical protein GXY83_07820, partial [Rhodopirellula sp.]|nr:hypothetical protein [Rhodopirellula sp.]